MGNYERAVIHVAPSGDDDLDDNTLRLEGEATRGQQLVTFEIESVLTDLPFAEVALDHDVVAGERNTIKIGIRMATVFDGIDFFALADGDAHVVLDDDSNTAARDRLLGNLKRAFYVP